jgi:hypothetical protein
MDTLEIPLHYLIHKKIQIVQPGHPFNGRIGTVQAVFVDDGKPVLKVSLPVYHNDDLNPTVLVNQFQEMFPF